MLRVTTGASIYAPVSCRFHEENRFLASKKTLTARRAVRCMNQRPTLHLIHGFTGSGKTTFARRLERELRAIRLSPDEWMVVLYGADPPTEHFQEFQTRVTRLIWDLAVRVLHLGLDVVLDFGFWSRASRDDARARAQSIGVPWKLYFVDCSEEVMRRRVLERTEELPVGVLVIDEAAFELFKTRFEPLGPDEEHVRIRTDGQVPNFL